MDCNPGFTIGSPDQQRSLCCRYRDQKVNLDYDEPELQETTSITGLLLRLAASLLLIVGLAWVIIRVFGRQAARKLQGEWLQVLMRWHWVRIEV